MHLLVIGVDYYPEQTSVGPFTTGLCEHLVEQGHRVSVITAFPYYPQWRIRDEYRGMVYKRERIHDVDVRRVIHYVPSKPRNLIQRLLHDISFSFNVFLATLLLGPFDGIFCSSPPPFVPMVAWMASRLRGVPFAINLTDLAADAAVSLGMMGGLEWLALWARTFEKFNYERATGISVLCPAFKENLAGRGVAAEKISIVQPWADTETIHPMPRKNDFVVLHAGNMGLKEGLQAVVEAARLTEASSLGITWKLVGDGEERQRLQESAARYGLARLRFLPLQPNNMVPFMLAAPDVLLLVQKATVIDAVIPSKLLTYMASGRPIVASVHPNSEVACRIIEAGCGRVVAPEDPEEISEAILYYFHIPHLISRNRKKSKEYASEHYKQDKIMPKYESVLSDLSIS